VKTGSTGFPQDNINGNLYLSDALSDVEDAKSVTFQISDSSIRNRSGRSASSEKTVLAKAGLADSEAANLRSLSSRSAAGINQPPR